MNFSIGCKFAEINGDCSGENVRGREKNEEEEKGNSKTLSPIWLVARVKIQLHPNPTELDPKGL
jgi:hypothetical protein